LPVFVAEGDIFNGGWQHPPTVGTIARVPDKDELATILFDAFSVGTNFRINRRVSPAAIKYVAFSDFNEMSTKPN